MAWTVFTPEATLFSDQREQLTTHFFSPNPAEGFIVRATWQDSHDTSTVWARAIASVADPKGLGRFRGFCCKQSARKWDRPAAPRCLERRLSSG